MFNKYNSKSDSEVINKLIPIILTLILLIALIFSIYVVMKKRRKAGVTGIKSALTPICLYLVAVTNLLAYWLIGLVLWGY